jgi:hypothetical protein
LLKSRTQQEGSMDVSCTKCKPLETEVEILKLLLSSSNDQPATETCEKNSPNNPQVEDESIVELKESKKALLDTTSQLSHTIFPSISVEIPSDVSSVASLVESSTSTSYMTSPSKRNNNILVRAESGRIQSLRDILGTRQDSPRNMTSVGSTFQPPPLLHSNSNKSLLQSIASPHKVRLLLPKPIVVETSCCVQPQIKKDPESAFESLPTSFDHGAGDEIFKYAVVLACPAPNIRSSFSAISPPSVGKTAQRSSLTSRSHPADFKRSRSVPEDCTKDVPMPRTSSIPKFPSASVIEDKAPSCSPSKSPKKKHGWLANLQTRFRAATKSDKQFDHFVQAASTQKHKEQAVHSVSGVPRAVTIYPVSAQVEANHDLEALNEFSFPYGNQTMIFSQDLSMQELRRVISERNRTYRSDAAFVLLLSGPEASESQVTYAICMVCPLFPSGSKKSNLSQNLPEQCCMCLLSPFPFFGLFFKVLFGVAALWENKRKALLNDPKQSLELSHFIELFQELMGQLKEMKVPSMGGWGRMSLFSGSPLWNSFTPPPLHIAFHRPHNGSLAMERRAMLLEFAAPTLFSLLSLDQVLFLLGCLCCERKVLLVSDHVNLVSSCVLALISLLEPLQWAGPIITVLPPRLDELLDAPVPLIAGRVSVNSAKIPHFSSLSKPMKGVVEMNLDQNNLCMHEEDLRNYHELKLPGCDDLTHVLHEFSSQLFEKDTETDFPTIDHKQACETMCDRIKEHMEAICSLAIGESTSFDSFDTVNSQPPPSNARTPQTISSSCSTEWNKSSSQRLSALELLNNSSKKCSELVMDYIERFQCTQMFSMFTTKREEEKANIQEELEANEELYEPITTTCEKSVDVASREDPKNDDEETMCSYGSSSYSGKDSKDDESRVFHVGDSNVDVVVKKEKRMIQMEVREFDEDAVEDMHHPSGKEKAKEGEDTMMEQLDDEEELDGNGGDGVDGGDEDHDSDDDDDDDEDEDEEEEEGEVITYEVA